MKVSRESLKHEKLSNKLERKLQFTFPFDRIKTDAGRHRELGEEKYVIKSQRKQQDFN